MTIPNTVVPQATAWFAVHAGRSLLGTAVLILSMVGCGGGEAPPPLAATPATPAAPAAPTPVKAVVAQPVEAAAAEAAPEVPVAPPAWMAPAGTDPQQIFQFRGPAPQETVERAPRTLPSQLATVVAAVRGVKPFTLQMTGIVPREADPANPALGSPNGAPQTAAPVAPPVNDPAAQGNPVAVPPPMMQVTFPPGFQALPGTPDPSGLPRAIRCERTRTVMVLVSAGLLQLGTNAGPTNTRPAVSVVMDPFYMDQNEVTVEQFQLYRDEQLARKKVKVPAPLNEASGVRNQPALGVPWSVAQAFLRAVGKELPTEAEWEYAARGPQAFPFVWGTTRPVWPDARQPLTITTVCQYPGDRSPFGVYDLAGNGREWCADWYSDAGHQDAKAAGSVALRGWTGAKKASTPNARVVKGGAPDWSTWYREGHVMNERSPLIGFRGVLRLPREARAATVRSTGPAAPASPPAPTNP